MHPKAPLALGAALLVAIHNATPALSVSDYALIFVAIAYTVSLVRDIRPIRALRKENADLRGQLADCQRDLDETKRKLDEQSQRSPPASTLAPSRPHKPRRPDGQHPANRPR
jgi:hypothetical protein